MPKFSILPKGNSTANKNKVTQDNEQKNVINVNVDNVENITLSHNITSQDSDKAIETMEIPNIMPTSHINDGDIVEVQANGDSIKPTRTDRRDMKRANDDTFTSKQTSVVAQATRAGVYLVEDQLFLHTLKEIESYTLIGVDFTVSVSYRFKDNGDSWGLIVNISLSNDQEGRTPAYRVNDNFYFNKLITLVVSDMDLGEIRYVQGIVLESTDNKIVNLTSGSVRLNNKEMPAMINDNTLMGQIVAKEIIPEFVVFPTGTTQTIEFEIPKVKQDESLSVDTHISNVWSPDPKAVLLGKKMSFSSSKSEVKLVRKNNNPNNVMF